MSSIDVNSSQLIAVTLFETIFSLILSTLLIEPFLSHAVRWATICCWIHPSSPIMCGSRIVSKTWYSTNNKAFALLFGDWQPFITSLVNSVIRYSVPAPIASFIDSMPKVNREWRWEMTLTTMRSESDWHYVADCPAFLPAFSFTKTFLWWIHLKMYRGLNLH